MMGQIAVVKYNAGNIRSVLCALSNLGLDAKVTDDPNVLKNASRVIFPGVGEASSAMKFLRDIHLDDVLKSLTQPFLGICLGMQLMCDVSEENTTPCLNIFPSPVVKFCKTPSIKIPHMGWNLILPEHDHLFSDLPADPWCYFVHSYYVPLSESTIASCRYGDVTFSAALRTNNFWGVQFHPEKSGSTGQRILQNFLSDSL